MVVHLLKTWRIVKNCNYQRKYQGDEQYDSRWLTWELKLKYVRYLYMAHFTWRTQYGKLCATCVESWGIDFFFLTAQARRQKKLQHPQDLLKMLYYRQKPYRKETHKCWMGWLCIKQCCLTLQMFYIKSPLHQESETTYKSDLAFIKLTDLKYDFFLTSFLFTTLVFIYSHI